MENITTPFPEPSTTPASDTSQTPPPTNNPQKKKFMLILIVFFVIFFLTMGTAATIFFYKDSNNKKAEPQPTKSITLTTNTSDWNTYTNEKHGFSFKYPTMWLNREVKNQIIFSDDEIPSGRINVDIASKENLQDSLLDEALNGKIIGAPSITSIEKVKIGEHTALEVHHEVCHPSIDGGDCLLVVFESGDTVFSFSPWVHTQRYNDLNTIFAMISTFKSLDPSITTPTSSKADCMVGGCSGQLCVEESDEDGMVSTCEYTEAYACYKTAKCEVQASGTCGWTQTPELTSCLDSAQ